MVVNMKLYITLDLQFFAGEKTEKATPKKRQDARKKGQVLKSQDVTAAALLLIMFIFIFFYARFIYERLHNLTEDFLNNLFYNLYIHFYIFIIIFIVIIIIIILYL